MSSPRLRRHLQQWLGSWPPAGPVEVVGSARRELPGWDGRVFPLMAVKGPGGAVLSVPPGEADAIGERVRGALPSVSTWDELVPLLPNLAHRSHRIVYSGIFRWSDHPTDLPDGGVWVDAGDPRVPEWLRPFGHEVLISWDPDTGDYLAGVGIKHHDEVGHELAVGTEPAARGRGLARRLVAQAARRVVDEGGVPTYQHDPLNVASAHVAEAAGFPDLGWRSLAMP